MKKLNKLVKRTFKFNKKIYEYATMKDMMDFNNIINEKKVKEKSFLFFKRKIFVDLTKGEKTERALDFLISKVPSVGDMIPSDVNNFILKWFGQK